VRSRLAVAGTVVLLAGPTVLAFFSGGYFDRPRLVAALACCCLVVLVSLSRSTPLPGDLPGRLAIGGLGALGALGALSVTWAPLRAPVLDDASRAALYLGALLAAAALLRGRAVARAAEPALLAGSVLVILVGLSERLLPGVFELARSNSALGRLEQPLTYWNAVGALAAMGLVLALRVAGDGERPRVARAAASAAAAPLGAGLLLTFSRGSLLAAAAGVLVLCLLVPTSRQLRAVAFGLGIAVASGTVAALLPAVASLEGSAAGRRLQGTLLLVWLLALMAIAVAVSLRAGHHASDALRRVPARAAAGVVIVLAVFLVLGATLDPGSGQAPADGATATRLRSTDSNRYEYWKVAVGAFAEHPLRGVGAGGFEQEWLRERTIDDDARDAHGLGIETAAELGLLGLLALALLIGGVGVAACRALERDRALAAGPVAALVAWALHAQIDWDWEMPALTLIAIALAGLLVATGERPAMNRPTLAARIALAGLSLAVALPLAAALRSVILTDRATTAVQAQGRLDAAGFAEARDLLRRAGELNPDPNPEIIDAGLLIGRGRESEAAASLERSLQVEPDNPGAWRLLAIAVRRSDPARSAEAERRARALAPRRPG
jgi:hypothetical protein